MINTLFAWQKQNIDTLEEKQFLWTSLENAGSLEIA